MELITMLLVLAALSGLVLYVWDAYKQEQRRRDRAIAMRVIRYLEASSGRRVT